MQAQAGTHFLHFVLYLRYINFSRIKKFQMKQLFIFLIATIILHIQGLAQTNALYPISEAGLLGYIDASGAKVIAPQFKAVGDFAEGLAPARTAGRYGYIDTQGAYVIPARYDAAGSFVQGYAKVYIDGKPFFIDKEGNTTFEHDYQQVGESDRHGLVIVKTQNGAYGVINGAGDIIVDTIYASIGEFSEGYAVLSRWVQKNTGDDLIEETGVIDVRGKQIIPFGKYDDIYPFVNGYAKVYFNDKKYVKGVVDTTGTLVFTMPDSDWSFDYGDASFSDGQAIIAMEKGPYGTYPGVIDLQGNIITSNEAWEDITTYQNGRAFARDTERNFYLLDRSGRVLNEQPFTDIHHKYYFHQRQFFDNGMEVVKTDKGWVAIDTTGSIVAVPEQLSTSASDFKKVGSVFLYRTASFNKGKHGVLYGFWNMETGRVIPSQFSYIDFYDDEKELIYVIKDDLAGYINVFGDFVWQQEEKEKEDLKTLNIDYMLMGYFRANAPAVEELDGIGGWATSDNTYKALRDADVQPKDHLSLSVEVEEQEAYMEKYTGIKLRLSNASGDTMYFDVQDSRLDMVLQARDEQGEWRDIMFLPGSGCGNSYHILHLPAGYYWDFIIPVMEGEYKTSLRVKLYYKEDLQQEKQQILYSNEYEGSINPGQLWYKKDYQRIGVMDPYRR